MSSGSIPPLVCGTTFSSPSLSRTAQKQQRMLVISNGTVIQSDYSRPSPRESSLSEFFSLFTELTDFSILVVKLCHTPHSSSTKKNLCLVYTMVTEEHVITVT